MSVSVTTSFFVDISVFPEHKGLLPESKISLLGFLFYYRLSKKKKSNTIAFHFLLVESLF